MFYFENKIQNNGLFAHTHDVYNIKTHIFMGIQVEN